MLSYIALHQFCKVQPKSVDLYASNHQIEQPIQALLSNCGYATNLKNLTQPSLITKIKKNLDRVIIFIRITQKRLYFIRDI